MAQSFHLSVCVFQPFFRAQKPLYIYLPLAGLSPTASPFPTELTAMLAIRGSEHFVEVHGTRMHVSTFILLQV